MTLVSLPWIRDVPHTAWKEIGKRGAGLLPKGLYARSILIVILPMVILQSVITFIFLERHWALVTNRLSTVLTQDLSAIIDIYQSYPQDKNLDTLTRIAQDRMKIDLEFLPKGSLPPALPKPFFSIVDAALSNEIRKQIGRPFWLDTVGRSNLIEIRIELPHAIMRAIAYRSAAYASNSYIFILWMLGTSFVLIVVAVAFLRTQIRPILRLSRAAEAFGKGREIDFRPRGAREVRQAGYAFIAMKRRIERVIEQRTAMLNGVSHDLRTVITRFKLSLALMDHNEDSDEMKRDVDEMQRMLEGYLAFARGDAGEPAVAVDIREFLDDIRADSERHGAALALDFTGDPVVRVRPDAFKRCVGNLVANAHRHARHVTLEGGRDGRFLTIHVDDDGPGIPVENRDDVFRPFVRLDQSRNQDAGGTGLGLSIARDIARSHGGDIMLGDSPFGGLRATVRIPV